MIHFGSGHSKAQFMLERDDILSGLNFEKYAAEHGQEKAHGFIDATAHICNHLEDILGDLVKENNPTYSGYIVRTNTKLLYESLHDFLNNPHLKGISQQSISPEKP